jgi:hypothetical protein
MHIISLVFSMSSSDYLHAVVFERGQPVLEKFHDSQDYIDMGTLR